MVQNDRAPDSANRPTDFPFTEGVAVARLAIARHTRGLSADHLDIFLGSATATDPDARIARTWRVPCTAATQTGRDSALVPGMYAAEEIAPHRAAYLSLDTNLEKSIELSEGRGIVEPLLITHCLAQVGTNVVRLATDVFRITLTMREDTRWQCEIESIATKANQHTPPEV